MSAFNIVLLPGDGVGPEVTAQARAALEAVGKRFGHEFAFTPHHIGGVAIDETGEPLPAETLAACQAADAVFLGAVGGPKWDSAPKRPEQGLLGIRKALGLYANIRPTLMHKPLLDQSPLKREIVEGVDMLVFRELTGGSYFGEKKQSATEASDLCLYTVGEIERIARKAFAAARARRNKVTSVDKANVMATSRLWRESVIRIHQTEFEDVELEHVLIDSMTMHVLRNPRAYDVIVTENMFGDILTDELSALGGSLGLGASASLGDFGPGLFEPVHGSAPDIAGRDLANPIGAVLSAAMLLRHGLKLSAEADALDAAVAKALEGGARTRDLGGELGCTQMGAATLAHL
ncbi:MAG: 3-isopropylmalate dehydrogenase [Hyphomonadaceae bacterium JAD_PAG50586_4]|nr:MAG: 3-isopropylmalate dehydrogenase [Hyphomonadaceae bacterium JAD_PAG50586_4]